MGNVLDTVLTWGSAAAELTRRGKTTVLTRRGATTALDPKSTFYRAYTTNEELMRKLKDLGLDHKRLYALHQIFSAMDRDNSGEINVMEFFNYIDVPRTRFSEKAFAIMDKDGSGEVDFIEFVLAVWNYCSFSHASLVRFAFDLYDVDSSGEIEHDEVVRCVREVWGSAWEESSSAQKIVAKLDAIMEGTSSGKLNVQRFEAFAMRHPMLLFPAFQLQTELQKKVLGEAFWLRAAKKRGNLNVRELTWTRVAAVANVAHHQSSSTFLRATEDDTGEQIDEQLDEQLDTKKPRGLAKLKQTLGGGGGAVKRTGNSVRSFIGSTSRRSSIDTNISASHTTSIVTAQTAAALRSPLSESPSPAASKASSPKRSRKLQAEGVNDDAVATSATSNSSSLVVEDIEDASVGRRASGVFGRSTRLASHVKPSRNIPS